MADSEEKQEVITFSVPTFWVWLKIRFTTKTITAWWSWLIFEGYLAFISYLYIYIFIHQVMVASKKANTYIQK